MRIVGRCHRAVAAVGLIAVLAACGTTEPALNSDGRPYPLPEVPVPERWGPVPLSTVWSAEPGIDLDSRPAQIARGYTDGLIYINAGVGMDEGYEGFTEFTGISHNSAIPESKPPVTGTRYGHIYEISHSPGVDVTNYLVTVCTSDSHRAEWVPRGGYWWSFVSSVYEINFSLPGGPDEIGGGGRISTKNRDQHPSWNVFEEATYLGERGRVKSPDDRDERARINEECADDFPPPRESRTSDGPLPPKAWYPGWPAGGN